MKLSSPSDFLRFAGSIALIICSAALLVFSLTSTTVKAAPPRAADGFQAVGAVVKDGRIQVVGYKFDPLSNTGSATILASY
jgi:hypothetical protein